MESESVAQGLPGPEEAATALRTAEQTEADAVRGGDGLPLWFWPVAALMMLFLPFSSLLPMDGWMPLVWLGVMLMWMACFGLVLYLGGRNVTMPARISKPKFIGFVIVSHLGLALVILAFVLGHPWLYYVAWPAYVVGVTGVGFRQQMQKRRGSGR